MSAAPLLGPRVAHPLMCAPREPSPWFGTRPLTSPRPADLGQPTLLSLQRRPQAFELLAGFFGASLHVVLERLLLLL